MSEEFDPLQRPSHSKDALTKLFKGDSRVLQKLQTENPKLYTLYRREAERFGIVAPRPVWADPNYRDRFNEKPMSEKTIRLRATVPLDEVKGYYTNQSNGNQNNLSQLATTDPERYRLIKSAAIAWGIIPEQPMPREPEPRAPERQTLLTVSPEYCKRLGLPEGKQVTQAEFLKIHEIIHNIDEAKRLADAQRAKDAATDASTAEYGRVVPPADAVELAKVYSQK